VKPVPRESLNRLSLIDADPSSGCLPAAVSSLRDLCADWRRPLYGLRSARASGTAPYLCLQALPLLFDIKRMELAGLEPATSWVRYRRYRVLSGYFGLVSRGPALVNHVARSVR
jgi:hypothetical protein